VNDKLYRVPRLSVLVLTLIGLIGVLYLLH
jgi:hypothetical protein